MSKMDADGSLTLESDPRVCRCIPLAEIDNAILLSALKLWDELRGDRPYPARAAVTPRVLKPILRNTSLLKVIDGGADYEYRIVGDAYVMAHGHSYQGLRWSETAALAKGFHSFVKPVFDSVVRDGAPVATRGWIERGGQSTGHVYCEYVYLPLGEGAVDHILVVAVYLRRGGSEAATAGSSSFTI